MIISYEGTGTRALFHAFSSEMMVAQSDQYRTQAEIKALDKAVAEVRFSFFGVFHLFFCQSWLAHLRSIFRFLSALQDSDCLPIEPGENAQQQQWRRYSREKRSR